jgi:hypothetical protein
MYVLDPKSGARRRALARDQVASARRRLGDAATTTWRDARNRSEGFWAELKKSLKPGQPADGVLEDRVRSALGALIRYPRHVEVRAQNGVVILAGAVAADEVERLVRCIRRTRGVDRVDNQLQVYSQPSDLPDVQPPIPPRPPGPRVELMHRNWSPSTRALAGTVGAALILEALRRSRPVSLVMTTAGILAVVRAATNRPLTETPTARTRGEGQAFESPEPSSESFSPRPASSAE